MPMQDFQWWLLIGTAFVFMCQVNFCVCATVRSLWNPAFRYRLDSHFRETPVEHESFSATSPTYNKFWRTENNQLIIIFYISAVSFLRFFYSGVTSEIVLPRIRFVKTVRCNLAEFFSVEIASMVCFSQFEIVGLKNAGEEVFLPVISWLHRDFCQDTSTGTVVFSLPRINWNAAA